MAGVQGACVSGDGKGKTGCESGLQQPGLHAGGYTEVFSLQSVGPAEPLEAF